MNETAGKRASSRRASAQLRARGLLAACGMAASLQTASLAQDATGVFRSADEVRRLAAEEAARGLPVRLRGVVTFFDETLYSRFIQDGSAGIYLRESTNTPALHPGQLIEVVGVTSPGEYAPIVEPSSVRVLGEAPLPAAKTSTFEQLASGREDSQLVEIAGIVRSVKFEPLTQHHVVVLASGGGRLTIYARALPVRKPENLVDATVRVRGVCSTQFNRQRQLFAIRLMVPRPEDLVIETPTAADPFSAPTRSLGSLLQFAPQGTYGHRVKVHGRVVFHQPGRLLYIQDERHGLRVETRQHTPLAIGDEVEILGFPSQGVYTPILEDAIYRRTGGRAPVIPIDVDVDAALSGAHDCRLIQIVAKLLDRTRQGQEQFLVLEADSYIFHAHLESQPGEDVFAQFENGSVVSVAGVCVIEPGEWAAGESWRARFFQILLRSAADVVVEVKPPWWTLRRLLWTVGVLLIVVLAAFTWVAVLRRRVQEQTHIIRQRLLAEAALKERYVDLFENANDMVFTHDLVGRLTSINRSGERLLQRNREKLLSLNLADLVAEDQRPAARQWLEQVVKGGDLSVAEWDFLNAAGHRLKMEISGRLIEENGKPSEVEGIARDITERRRLERELLEVSSREQHRIGHDLHDGVCQQLAGIAYRVEALGDQMEEQASPEAAEARKIGALISEATVQARSVARGLFPVRLEENGLVCALEELAENATARYRIECAFHCDRPPAKVDNETALHLYYIAQEATLNAARHSQAAQVRLSLSPQDGRYVLTVRDRGVGFRPSAASLTGLGIRIMRYRAKVIGATLDVKSQPGHGTELTCVFAPVQSVTVPERKNV